MVDTDLPYVRGSATSREAAESMQETAGGLRAKVLGHVMACGPDGTTCDAAEDALDMRHQTASARLRELVKIGLVYDSGRREPTRSGRKAVVWVAT